MAGLVLSGVAQLELLGAMAAQHRSVADLATSIYASATRPQATQRRQIGVRSFLEDPVCYTGGKVSRCP